MTSFPERERCGRKMDIELHSVIEGTFPGSAHVAAWAAEWMCDFRAHAYHGDDELGGRCRCGKARYPRGGPRPWWHPAMIGWHVARFVGVRL